jgi:hypothetical protein
MQEQASKQIVDALDHWRDLTEKLSERTFLAVFGSPALQSAVGIDPAAPRPVCKAAKNPLHHQLVQARIRELKARIPAGGLREAVIRGLIYAGLSRRAIDERGFEMVQQLRSEHGDLPLAEFKTLVREQFNMLLIDQDAALAAIPSMLPPDDAARREGLGLIRKVLAARGTFTDADKERFDEVARLFGFDEKTSGARSLAQARTERRARTS